MCLSRLRPKESYLDRNTERNPWGQPITIVFVRKSTRKKCHELPLTLRTLWRVHYSNERGKWDRELKDAPSISMRPLEFPLHWHLVPSWYHGLYEGLRLISQDTRTYIHYTKIVDCQYWTHNLNKDLKLLDYYVYVQDRVWMWHSQRVPIFVRTGGYAQWPTTSLVRMG